MPVLSNGQVIGISSERARYHATRQNIRVSRQTPHTQLYPLVDVVLTPKGNKSVSGQARYYFTGHTLEDQDWLNTLSAEDRCDLMDWLNDSSTRYEIEGARRKLIYDDLPVAIESHPYPEQLYSNLRRLVVALPVMSMPARQWRQTLLNLQQQGIRQEELNYSGLMEYLTEQAEGEQQTISKQTVLDRIDFFPVHLEMTNERVAEGHRHGEQGYRARYRHVSLFGGENYREWLVTLPDYPLSHFGSHYTERNVLLHIRTKTRLDSHGRKLLFIEEIQSDWHQAGIKNANPRIRIDVPSAPFRKEWVGLGLKLMLLHACNEGFAGLAWTDGAIQSARYQTTIPSLQRLYDQEIARHLLGLARNWGGEISTTELVSKAPALRVKRVRGEGGHDYIRRSTHKLEERSVLENYNRMITLRVPVFIIPADMAHYVLREGLPMFGARHIQAA